MTLARVMRRLAVELRYSGLSAWRAVVELYVSDDLTYAASIAFFALLSLFPFLLLVMSILSAITADEQARLTVLSFVFQFFPARLDFVTDQLNALEQARFRVGLAGGVALAWASLGVFGAVTTAVNAAWGVETQRSFLKHRLVSFVMLIAAGVFVTLGLVVASAAKVIGAAWFGTVLGQYGWIAALETWAANSLTIVLLIVGVGFVFYFIPNAKTRLRDVWAGAIVTGLLWRAALSVFGSYIVGNRNLAVIQGSIAVVVVFLLWVYVSAVILMFGVEFTASYARLRRHRSDAMPAAATPRT